MESSNKSLSVYVKETGFVITFSEQESLIKVESPFEAVVDFTDPKNILIFFEADTNEENISKRKKQIFSLVDQIRLKS